MLCYVICYVYYIILHYITLYIILYYIMFQLQMLSLQLLHRKVQFTACGFFPLDFTLLYSVRTKHCNVFSISKNSENKAVLVLS
jgi:hypothetical protein